MPILIPSAHNADIDDKLVEDLVNETTLIEMVVHNLSLNQDNEST